MSPVIHGVDLAILLYFLVLNSFYALLLVLSIPEIWEQTRLAEDEDFQRLMQSDALPPISILVPAHNESATIEASVTAILTLEYRNFEIIVVNDGSKDDTLERLRHAFDLYEVPRTYPETIATKPLRALYRSRTRTRLLVLDKENGGKADSLNAAINASRFPLVIAVDADTLIEPDALLRLTRPFLLGRHIAAVGGTVRVANGCTVKDGRVIDARVPGRFLPGVQVVEYLRAFLFGRLFPSFRIRWRGPRSPNPGAFCRASGSGGTAAWSPRCGSTRGCSSTPAMVAWVWSRCRSSRSVRCSPRSSKCSGT